MILRRRLKQRWRVLSWFFAMTISMVFLHEVYAGSLTPSSSPAGTMHTVDAIYDSLAGSTYDSSGISADNNGNALEITKCIILKTQGGGC